MTPAPAPTPAPTSAAPPVLAAWPRSAQGATALLLVLALVLLAVYAYGSWRGGSRPTDLQQGPALTHRIDLNQASHAELLQLPGVGENLAKRIEEYRREHGNFRTVDELASVHGVGTATLQKLRPWLCVYDPDEEPDQGETKPLVLPKAPAPHKTEASGGRGRPKEPAGTSTKGGGKAAKVKGPIDVNRASAAELQTLPGIGPVLAQRVIEERRKGRFQSIEDLRRVPGIGAKTLERLRPYIRVDSPSEDAAA